MNRAVQQKIISLDGVADGTYTITPGGSWGVISNNTRYIGGLHPRRSGGGYHSGHIAELIVFSGSLSTTKRTTVETYLQNKWDITVATQSVDPVLDQTTLIRLKEPTMKKFKSFKDFVKDVRGIKPPEHKYDSSSK